MVNTLRDLFATTFAREMILEQAKKVGAIQRLRDIHPADFGLSLASCAIGDEERSIATARRMFFDITQYMPEESSFYNKFNAGTVVLMKQLYLNALAGATKEQREVLAEVFKNTGILDIQAIDATQLTLPASAAEEFPSTHDAHGGIKLTTTLSVLYQVIVGVSVSCSRTHDRKALCLPRWLHGRLLLLDRGYADFRLYATIEDRKGYFLSPLKANVFPIIKAIRVGLGQCHVGKPLDGTLPYQHIVDVDAEFKVRKGGRRIFRVVGVTVPHEMPNGTVEWVTLWFVTNLPADTFTAEHVATIYRFRWEVETLFHTLKAVGRLDQLKTSNRYVIETFVYATLLGMVLAHEICAQMRRKRRECEPSVYRVTALLHR
ncbi:MAG: IS4 family transposase [Fimbriimonadaceae bacterium]